MRARNLKPGFFKNEELAACTPWARLCFAGLWLLADREGRLEDRPKRIKGELFAFDSIEVDPLLVELATYQFILRYVGDGKRFIQILKFREHQAPHYSEKPSTIPLPPDEAEFPESGGLEGWLTPEHEAEEFRENGPIKRGSQPPDSLNPDSLNPDSLNPDSLNPEEATSDEVARPRQADDPPEPAPEIGTRNRKSAATTNGHDLVPACPHHAILALWQQVLPETPQHRPALWGGTRASHLRARWRETAAEKHWASEADGLDYFERLFHYMRGSPFLMGRAPPSNGRPAFVVELEWLVHPGNWAKVIEGKYTP